MNRILPKGWASKRYPGHSDLKVKSVLPKGWASRSYAGHNQHIPGTTNYLRSRTFQSWFNMIVRCHYPSNKDWADYGGRGITVHSKWLLSFDSFIQDMGHRPKGMTLDRINPNRGYTPGNCRWSDAKTQARNKRSTTGSRASNRGSTT